MSEKVLWPMHNSKDFQAAYHRYILGKTVPEVEGAVTTITKLKSPFLLGIVTSAPRFEVEHFLISLGLDKTDFFLIQAAEDSEYHKPDPRVVDSTKVVTER